MSYYTIFGIYILVANLWGWAQMGIDKKRAKNSSFRISEKQLFLTALLGGSLGTWAGMRYFRHKTQHWSFKIGIPAIVLLHLALLFYYFAIL